MMMRIDEFDIAYEKIGHGTDIVLFIPEALGTVQSQFQQQFDPDNDGCLDLDCFTFICIDLPGWGRSNNQERPYGPTILDDDAIRCDKLMNKLGYNEYSIYGFGLGGQIAIIMAKKIGSRIKSMILHATATYSDDKLIQNYRKFRDPDCWNDGGIMFRQLKHVYNNDLDRMAYDWNKYIDLAVNKFNEYYPDGLLIMDNQIQCPSLILYGDQDKFIDIEQINYLTNNLSNNRLIIFSKCGHHLNDEQPNKFKNIVEKFLLENFWCSKNCLY